MYVRSLARTMHVVGVGTQETLVAIEHGCGVSFRLSSAKTWKPRVGCASGVVSIVDDVKYRARALVHVEYLV